MKKESILVTGGAGYVGSPLLRALLQRGYAVTTIDNLRFGGDSLIGIWNNPSFAFVRGDITDNYLIETILKRNHFKAVVHLAAIVGDPACAKEPELAWKVNWDAAVNLVKACKERRIHRFVFASTCSNYGKMPSSDDYVHEESPLAPVSLYAKSKVQFEKYLLNMKSETSEFYPTSLRFATVYGISPRLRFDLTVNEFTKELALKRELVVYGEQFWRPYCHVLDFSRAILKVLEAKKEKVAYNVFNVGDTRENYSKQMIVEEIKKVIPDAKIKYVKKNEDPRDYRVSFQKIKNELGYEISRTVPQGIKEITELIESGVVSNPDDPRYRNS